MQKGFKTILAAALALGMTASAFAGCSTNRPALDGDISGAVVSNGGFVVEKGNYFYFINGQESYTSSNEFGSVVKGSLMRISKSDLSAGKFGKSEIVVPSLMVAGDHTSGIYIYGDRVYYATPTTAKNQSGVVESSYLDFKSTKLDGTDTSDHYFRLEDNSTTYRFVEENGVVYCMYSTGNDLYSFNTKEGVSTLLVQGAKSCVLPKDVTKPGAYYTMNVQVDIDKASNYTDRYTQIYYVSASATEAPYTYEYDHDYLTDYKKENGQDAMPYVNLGTLVLDGRGSDSAMTQYNHNEGTTAYTPSGYTYTLVSYDNDGLYYTRSYVDGTSSSGDGGWLFYISDANLLSSSWNAVSGNANTAVFGAGEYNDIVAYDTTKASASAIMLNENGKHSYVYVDGTAIFRNDVVEVANGISVETTRIADAVTSAKLLFTEKNGDMGYVYYSETGTNGLAISRAVYNGTKENYNALLADELYQPVRMSYIDYTSDWYAPEKIGDYLFFPNAETFSDKSYNYVCVAPIKGTNADLKALNEKFVEIADEIQTTLVKYNSLGNLMLYHFWMNGENAVFNRYYLDQGMTGATPYANTDYFNAALKEAKEELYTDTYLYSEYFQNTFNAFHNKTGDYAGKFVDENGKDYSVQTYFYNWIGQMTDEELEEIDKATKTSLIQHVTVSEDEEETFPVWAIVLISVGGVLLVGGIVTIVIALVLKKNKNNEPKVKKEKLVVDTSDDKDIDVYAMDEPEEGTVEVSPVVEPEEVSTEIEIETKE